MAPLSSMSRLMVFNRLDEYKAEIDPTQVLALTSTEEINGEHSLTIKTTQELVRSDRILLQDAQSIWHEYVVMGDEAPHNTPLAPAHEYYCVWSLQYDLMGTYIDTQVGIVPGHASVPSTARLGMEAALSGTQRWQIGTISVTSLGSASFYRRNGYEGLKTVVEKWGGEISATITVANNKVTGRAVNLLDYTGSTTEVRRFDYSADLASIKRTLQDSPLYCRIVPLGKSEQTETGGYSRRKTIASVNSSTVWLEDAAMVPYVRIHDGQGGYEYPTLIVENDTYEEPSDLKTWATAHITDYTQPSATYEATVMQFAQAGMNVHGVATGDAVTVVDKTFSAEGLRLSTRVIKQVCDLLDPTNVKITLGTAKTSLAGQFSSISGQVNTLSEQIVSAGSFQATATYLSNLLAEINAQVNATGGYTYIVEGMGVRTFDAPVSDPTDGTTEATAVVEIKGGTIRIANSLTAQGEWDWKTVFTSGHIAADLVTAAALTAGYIGNANSGSYWDLDQNVLRIGTRTDQEINGAVDDAAKVATDYLTYNSSTGLDVGYTGTSAKTRITPDGVEVFDGDGTSIAYFGKDGNYVINRLGKATGGGKVICSSNGSVEVGYGNDIGAHFGYGRTRLTNTTPNGPYLTVGTRDTSEEIGYLSTCLGSGNVAKYQYTFAAGANCKATNTAATAMGIDCTASGGNSTAIGQGCTASNDNALALGCDNTSAGKYSCTSGGYGNTANANYSYAGGNRCATGSGATGYYQFVYGDHLNGGGTTAQALFGKFNTTTNGQLVVGAGSSGTRKNIFVLSVAGDITITGGLIQGSDRRLKKHIAYLGDEAASFVRGLKPVLFEKDEKRQVGFYAQDVEEVEPWDANVVTITDGMDERLPDMRTLDYTALIAPLVAYAQSLEKRIETLEGRIEALERGGNTQ